MRMVKNTTSKLSAIVCPSILNADLSDLANECRRLLEFGADYLHLDVMDGHFVPNLTFGPPLISSLRKKLGKDAFFDAHLMVSDPDKWLPSMSEHVNQFTFHLEAIKSDDEDAVPNLIKKVKKLGLRCGIAIKPNTPVEEILKYCAKIDTALIMTVEPGFGGQSFMPEQLQKVERVRSEFPTIDIQVDGGIGLSNVDDCSRAGANLIVSGTAIINSSNQAETINKLRHSVEKYLA